MEKFSIFINGDRHRCARCQCGSFNKIVYPVAILFTDTFELHCCDCNEIQSFDFECWSNMRIRPYEVEFSSGGVLDKVLKRLSEMSDEEIIEATRYESKKNERKLEDKYIERFTKPVVIDTEERAEALVDAIEKSMKREEEIRKTNLNIHEIYTYLMNVEKYTLAKMNNSEMYVMLDADDNLCCVSPNVAKEKLDLIYQGYDGIRLFMNDSFSDEEIINSTFDIVEPEVEEWIKCESSDDVILKFWTGKRIRFDNGFFKYEGCINDKNTTMTTFIIDVGNKVENYERWQYLKK